MMVFWVFTASSAVSLCWHVGETFYRVSGWLNFIQLKQIQSLWIQRQ